MPWLRMNRVTLARSTVSGEGVQIRSFMEVPASGRLAGGLGEVDSEALEGVLPVGVRVGEMGHEGLREAAAPVRLGTSHLDLVDLLHLAVVLERVFGDVLHLLV